MQREIVVGIGDIGCAAMNAMPDDPDRFAAFIAVHHGDYLREHRTGDYMYRVPRFQITDPGDTIQIEAHSAFMEHARLRLHEAVTSLQGETNRHSLLLLMALSDTDPAGILTSFAVSLDEQFQSAVFRGLGQVIGGDGSFAPLLERLGVDIHAPYAVTLDEIHAGAYLFAVEVKIDPFLLSDRLL